MSQLVRRCGKSSLKVLFIVNCIYFLIAVAVDCCSMLFELRAVHQQVFYGPWSKAALALWSWSLCCIMSICLPAGVQYHSSDAFSLLSIQSPVCQLCYFQLDRSIYSHTTAPPSLPQVIVVYLSLLLHFYRLYSKRPIPSIFRRQ